MRRGACLLVVVVLIGSLGAVPASAAFGAVVQLPAGAVYSPYDGPVTVTFTFAPGDLPEIFTVRIRQPGHGAIKQKDYLVDPETDTSPHDVAFIWPNLSVTAPTEYVLDVRRQDDGTLITSESFTLLPRLVSDLSATPSPFYPLLQDGYKDRTRVGFSLAADSVDTVARVYQADDFGRCCGPEIRTENLGPLAIGSRAWTWDGTADDASTVPRGTYFAKVSATDIDGASMTSKAQRVEATRGLIRRTATKQKRGSAFDRTADEQPTARGGECLVSRDREIHSADIVCANAEISILWRWFLRPGERIESVSFSIDDGYYGCHRTKGHAKTRSYIRVVSPPTSTCGVLSATIRYSYPVNV